MTQTTLEPPLLTVPEAAERLSVHPNTVRNMIARGDLPAVQARKGAAVRISPDALAGVAK